MINVRPRPELMGWPRLVVVVVERSLPDNIFITRILYLHLPQTLYMVSMFCFCVFQVECLSVKVLLVGCVGLFGGFSVVGGFSCSVCSSKEREVTLVYIYKFTLSSYLFLTQAKLIEHTYNGMHINTHYVY